MGLLFFIFGIFCMVSVLCFGHNVKKDKADVIPESELVHDCFIVIYIALAEFLCGVFSAAIYLHDIFAKSNELPLSLLEILFLISIVLTYHSLINLIIRPIQIITGFSKRERKTQESEAEEIEDDT